jgi:hypothetical protein
MFIYLLFSSSLMETAGEAAGFAVAFAIINSSPLMASFWGLVIYKDLKVCLSIHASSP